MKARTALAWLAFQHYSKSLPSSARALAFSPRSTRPVLSSLSTRPYLSSSRSSVAHYRSIHINTRRNMSATATDASEIEDVTVAENLRLVRENIQAAVPKSPNPTASVRLVAVSKTKPIELLRKAYEEGECRIFGENYVQELVDKVPQMPNDVQWHYIGALQSNKVNMLLKPFWPDQCHRLMLETVSSEKLARKLDNAMTKNATDGSKLSIYVQVNTSGEDSKSGVEPGQELVDLCQIIVKECASLELKGLMTIGLKGDASDFEKLVECRTAVAQALDVDPQTLELSMGMSGDYVEAIQYGATNVRVGSTIFGARNYAK